MQIIKQAAEKAKSLDPKKVAEVMRSGMPFHTVIGDIAFDKKATAPPSTMSGTSGRRALTARSGSSSFRASALGSRLRPRAFLLRRAPCRPNAIWALLILEASPLSSFSQAAAGRRGSLARRDDPPSRREARKRRLA